MIKLWRPRDTDWHNRWTAEEELNRLMLDGWRIVGTVPPTTQYEQPTVILEHPARWKDPHRSHGWARVKLTVWWYWHRFKTWWARPATNV